MLTRITQFYLPPTFASTNGMSHACLYSHQQSIITLWLTLITYPTKGRSLSWPGWLVTYWGGLPVQKMVQLTDKSGQSLSEAKTVKQMYHPVTMSITDTQKKVNLINWSCCSGRLFLAAGSSLAGRNMSSSLLAWLSREPFTITHHHLQ